MTASRRFRYAAVALTVGALAHIIGHVMGPKTIEFMGAPPDVVQGARNGTCLLYTSPSPRDKRQSRMPSSA